MLEIAQQFATLLDEAKFDEAAQLLAPECTYHYFEGNYQGREYVMNIYRIHYKAGLEDFDEIGYDSSAESLENGRFKINLSDRVRIGDRWHVVHSEEDLTIENGLITHIEHVQVPNEGSAFVQFLREVGRIPQSQ